MALDVAIAVYARTTYTPARLIIKQNQTDPSSGIIQCVRSEEVESTLEYLLTIGYGIGKQSRDDPKVQDIFYNYYNKNVSKTLSENSFESNTVHIVNKYPVIYLDCFLLLIYQF